MKNLSILAAIVAALGLVMVSFYPVSASSLPVGGTQYYLAGAGVTSSANTVQLTSLKTPDGRNITMTNFGTIGYAAIDPQSVAKIEDITFTGITQNPNGTATLTGVTRGLDFLYPYTTLAGLAKSHSGGATFIITNTAGFYYNEFAMPNNNNDFTWPNASSSISTKGYVDYVAFNGAAVINADTINRGVVQIATQIQTASSSGTGSTAATLVIPSANATSTYNANTAALRVVVTNNVGQIDSNFISSTTNNVGKNIQVFNVTGTSTFAVPTGITKVAVTLCAPGGSGGSNSGSLGNGAGSGGGGAGGYSHGIVNVSATTSVQVFVGATSTSPTSASSTWSTFGTNGFYMSATGGGPGVNSTSQGGTSGGLGGVGFGGSLNITGGTGGDGVYFNSTGALVIISGVGADSTYGNGGNIRYGSGSPSAGQNGFGYCAGGSGANGGTASGGTGSQGLVVVEW